MSCGGEIVPRRARVPIIALVKRFEGMAWRMFLQAEPTSSESETGRTSWPAKGAIDDLVIQEGKEMARGRRRDGQQGDRREEKERGGGWWSPRFDRGNVVRHNAV